MAKKGGRNERRERRLSMTARNDMRPRRKSDRGMGTRPSIGGKSGGR